MKKKYVPPEIEIEAFPQEDVIVCSNIWGEEPEFPDDPDPDFGNSFNFDR